MNPRVFVPHVPSRYDKRLGQWIPTVSIESAQTFGTLKILLPPDAGRMHTVPLSQVLKEQMIDFTEGDIIMCVGDPTLIAVTAVIAARKGNGKLRMLKWDKMANQYFLAEVSL